MEQKQRNSIVLSFRLLEMVFGAFLALCIFFGMKDAESSFYPVVTNFAVNEIHEVPGGVEMLGTMTKVRDCRFQEMMVYASTDDEKIPIAVDFEFLDSAKGIKSRAAISQRWGPWRIYIDSKYADAKIRMFVRHKCHSFYSTTTELHDFKIEKADSEITIIEQ